jgi:regulator of replication initiation timing
VDISDYNANGLQPTEAADKIRRLEDKLDEKLTAIIKLKSKLTSYRLRENPHLRLRPKRKILADLEENSTAEEQG